MAITFPGSAEITTRLDEFESRLPAFPARIFKLQRSITAANYDRTVAMFEAVTEAMKEFFSTAKTSGKTVTGQARAAAQDVVSSVRTGAATVGGQATAQGRKVAQTAGSKATELVDDAIDAVEDDVDDAIDAVEDSPGSGTPYEQWTKAELVERAKDLDIVGPTRMSKAELIDALRAA